MSNPVVHWEIMGRDPKATQSFYASLFDWEVDADNPMQYGMVNPGGDVGIGGGIGGDGDRPNRVSVYIEVDDLAAYLAKAERLGATTILPPTEVGDTTTIAMFADPDGNVTSLVKGDAQEAQPSN